MLSVPGHYTERVTIVLHFNKFRIPLFISLVVVAVGFAGSAMARDVAVGPNTLGYVDPGSGQLIWQMAVAGFVGALFYLKRVRLFVAKLFARLFHKKD